MTHSQAADQGWRGGMDVDGTRGYPQGAHIPPRQNGRIVPRHYERTKGYGELETIAVLSVQSSQIIVMKLASHGRDKEMPTIRLELLLATHD